MKLQFCYKGCPTGLGGIFFLIWHFFDIQFKNTLNLILLSFKVSDFFIRSYSLEKVVLRIAKLSPKLSTYRWDTLYIFFPIKLVQKTLSPLYHAPEHLSIPLYKLPLVFYRWTQKSSRHARESKFFQVLPAWFGPKLKNIYANIKQDSILKN